MGRVTYEEMAGYWPSATGDYADFMNTLPKVVFSRTLTAAGWAGSRIARGDLTEEITALKLAKPLRVELAEAKSFPGGTVIHVYQPVRSTG
jgi:dihydrofolate reductase